MSLKSQLDFAEEIESVGPVIGQHQECDGPVRSVMIKDINVHEYFYCEDCDKLFSEPNIKSRVTEELNNTKRDLL